MIHNLRIFNGQPAQPVTKKRKVKRRKGLRHVWETVTLPQLIEDGKKPATIREYKTHLAAWERYWAERSAAKEPSVPVTEGSFSPWNSDIARKRPDPPYNRISRRHLMDFRAWLTPGRAKKTVNNYMKSIRALQLAAAEQWPKAFKSMPPKVRALKCRKAKPKVYLPLDHVDAIYSACGVATWPRQSRLPACITAADYWRASIVLYFNFGFRTQELISYDSEFVGLRWGDVYFQSDSPGLSDGVNDHGWLVYTPRKQEAEKPEPLVLALSPIVAMHLRSIRPAEAAAADPVFPWPKSAKQMREQLKAILRRAGVRPKGASGVRRYYLYHFRKTCVTLHNLHRPGIAPFITGHADRDGGKGVSIQGRHYDNAELAAAEALLAFPQPESFSAIRNTNQMEFEF